ncbi:MFS sugar transporter [Pyricularia oryzae]|uniref:MFS sugar transporter n=1 Tax=Pyricularia grisea TaxID=148305 RepID=A0ABQ8N4J7_PYRGI|nr:MFS sugar transporter [Pyricularia oryzae]KAI6291141.1 MFS sugar transporter [Pyricularia grisea]KAH9430355.1 MFS sugar transporter [Pyricularia oryzae]KAI6252219.1 MFS sugar transporter [Pyricularia oryzae]KAI6265687.1 MFS sugar transporter [Pyricularia oryzae]
MTALAAVPDLQDAAGPSTTTVHSPNYSGSPADISSSPTTRAVSRNTARQTASAPPNHAESSPPGNASPTGPPSPSGNNVSPHGRHQGMSKLRACLVIATLSGVSFLNTMGSGILTVSLPTMARDVRLDDSLLLWPASVYSLAAGCTLLVFGAVGDIIGPKRVWITGACLYAAFTLGVGRSATGSQLIAFRSVLGVSIAMCLPTAVSLTTNGFGAGRWRNMAFAFQGMGQPLGYSTGLILGGIFTDTVGWRFGFYISGGINAVLAICALVVLPSPPRHDEGDGEQREVEEEATDATVAAAAVNRSSRSRPLISRLAHDVDWTGTLAISASMGFLSYVFSVVSKDYDRMAAPQNIALLVAAALLLPTFTLWVGRQERLDRPALIPNSLWRKAAFSSTCAAVFFTWAVFNAFQYFSALYFERIEHITALQTSLRFLPMVLVGAATNIVTGYLVETVEVRWLVVVSAIFSLFSPLIMALVRPGWGYWKGAFFAMLLSPLHPDVLFTVSNLIISRVYDGRSQSLAGAVFNAVSQVGNSVGLGLTAVVSSAVARSYHGSGGVGNAMDPPTGRPQHLPSSPTVEATLAGYHAAFWLMFGAAALVPVITFLGLRRGGKVGAVE